MFRDEKPPSVAAQGSSNLVADGRGPFVEAVLRSVVYRLENNGSPVIAPENVPLIESIKDNYQTRKLLERIKKYVAFNEEDKWTEGYLNSEWRTIRNSLQHGDTHAWPVNGGPVVNSQNAPVLSPLLFGFTTAIHSPTIVGSARNLATWALTFPSRSRPSA